MPGESHNADLYVLELFLAATAFALKVSIGRARV